MRSRAGIGVLMVAVLSGCGSDGGSDGRAAPAPAVAALTALVEAADDRGVGDDTIEVWVCHVPADTEAAIYGGLPQRLTLDPVALAAAVSTRATPFFDAISHGAYRPRFVPGGEVTMAADDRPEDCVDRAIEGSASDTGAVLAVADAEHAPGELGGFGTTGDPCGDQPCAVRDSRPRHAYVGGADFAPEWGEDPPMDLVEHEIGHTLGWLHSGVDAEGRYLSGIDLMSNSAAHREADPTLRDGPDTLALDRVVSGWLPMSDVVVADRAARAQRVTLVPSTGDSGSRLLLLPVDDETLLTVEYLVADGFDAHLPAGGVAVHRVRVRDGVVQPLEPLVGAAPFTDLLQPGAAFDSDGWSLVVGDGGRVDVQRAA